VSRGVLRSDATIERYVDCRYQGQSHELRIACDDEPSFAAIVGAFHDAHRRRYGFDRTDVRVEAVTFRAAALGPRGDVTVSGPSGEGGDPSATRAIEGASVRVFERQTLPANHVLRGPAVIVELDSTTWLDASSTLRVHESGALVIDVGPNGAGR
jgi:N-methylhydantoinase A